jgi:hypothetical protein
MEQGSQVEDLLRLVLVPLAYALGLVLIHLALRKTGLASRASRNGRALKASAVAALFFLFINTVNLCSPGYCKSYGFPLPYQAWSDAQASLNGVNLGIKPFTPSALLIDVVFAALVVLGVFLWFRGTTPAHSKGNTP